VLALDRETPRVSAVSCAVTNGLSTLIACAIGFSITPCATAWIADRVGGAVHHLARDARILDCNVAVSEALPAIRFRRYADSKSDIAYAKLRTNWLLLAAEHKLSKSEPCPARGFRILDKTSQRRVGPDWPARQPTPIPGLQPNRAPSTRVTGSIAGFVSGAVSSTPIS